MNGQGGDTSRVEGQIFFFSCQGLAGIPFICPPVNLDGAAHASFCRVDDSSTFSSEDATRSGQSFMFLVRVSTIFVYEKHVLETIHEIESMKHEALDFDICKLKRFKSRSCTFCSY